jgi:hypothetical protein
MQCKKSGKPCTLARFEPTIFCSDGEDRPLNSRPFFRQAARVRHPDVRRLRPPCPVRHPGPRRSLHSGLTYMHLMTSLGTWWRHLGTLMTSLGICFNFNYKIEPLTFVENDVAGLPAGIFAYQKYQFGNVFEGLGNVGIFYSLLVYFLAKSYIK